MKSVYSLVIGVVLVTASGLAVANEYLPYQESGYIILADGSDASDADKPDEGSNKSESGKERNIRKAREESRNSGNSIIDKGIREFNKAIGATDNPPRKPRQATGGVRG